MIYLWMSTSPGIRLGIGIFMLLIGVIGINFHSFKYFMKNPNLVVGSLFFMAILLIPKIENYNELVTKGIV